MRWIFTKFDFTHLTKELRFICAFTWMEQDNSFVARQMYMCFCREKLVSVINQIEFLFHFLSKMLP